MECALCAPARCPLPSMTALTIMSAVQYVSTALRFLKRDLEHAQFCLTMHAITTLNGRRTSCRVTDTVRTGLNTMRTGLNTI